MSQTTAHLCETSDEDDAWDIEVETEGDCKNHCDFLPGSKNSTTVSIKIINNEINTYQFNVSVSLDTNYTSIESNNLPTCESIGAGKSKVYEIEVTHQNGPDGDLETLNFDVRATCHCVYCHEGKANKLDIDIQPQLKFVQP